MIESYSSQLTNCGGGVKRNSPHYQCGEGRAVLSLRSNCGRRVERNSPGYQLGDGGAAPPFRSKDDESKDNSAPNKEVASSNTYYGRTGSEQ